MSERLWTGTGRPVFRAATPEYASGEYARRESPDSIGAPCLFEESIVDEQEFDASLYSHPFGTKDAMRLEAQARRNAALGIALWGRNAAELQRQLLAPHPEIPAGFDLADFRRLLRSARGISDALGDPRHTRLHSWAHTSATIFAGSQQLTEWEARCEVVRRAIEYLEK